MIISASRRTDLPAFYPEETIKKILQYKRSKLTESVGVVFWSKNPEPIIKYLPLLDKEGIKYYFHYTLNDYPKEIEPFVPPLIKRIETFKKLSKLLGKEGVIWRHDPIYSIDHHFAGVSKMVDYDITRQLKLGDDLHPYTEKMVISFMDKYSKIPKWLEEPSGKDDILKFLLSQCNHWGIELATCAEIHDVQGVKHNKCVDPDLLERIGMTDILKVKDASQRTQCGCIASLDIGEYHTCKHKCAYCYAK